MRNTLLVLLSAVGILTAAAVGCSPDSEGTDGADSDGADGVPTGGAGGSTATSTNTMSTGGSIISGCNPACEEGQFCSSAGMCLDEGSCATDPDCADGFVCDEPTSTCIPGGRCGGLEAQVEAIPPNLLLVLDRSCSMTQGLGGGVTKWEAAVAAIDGMTTAFTSEIRFGLTLFPDLEGQECTQGTIAIPVAPGNESAIQTLLNNALGAGDMYFPDNPCVTNIDTAMQQATTEPALFDPDRESYVALITDGKQSSGCSSANGDIGTLAVITELYQSQGIPTFVVGFGGEINPAQLNQFADAGGVPSGDPTTHYYTAEDNAGLAAVLDTIASKTLGCVFDLDSAPENPDEIFVFFDNTEKVENDPTHMEGWDYDPDSNQITFYGDACERLKAGRVMDVDVVFGCDEPTPE